MPISLPVLRFKSGLAALSGCSLHKETLRKLNKYLPHTIPEKEQLVLRSPMVNVSFLQISAPNANLVRLLKELLVEVAQFDLVSAQNYALYFDFTTATLGVMTMENVY